MQKNFLIVLLLVVVPAFAQSPARPKPKDLETVETNVTPSESKAPAKDVSKDIAKLDTSPDTKVTTSKRGDERIEEYRFKGKLYKTKITPARGPAYYLIDTKGDGSFVRVDGPDLKMNVPMWILLEW